jgi:hypothetical protein
MHLVQVPPLNVFSMWFTPVFGMAHIYPLTWAPSKPDVTVYDSSWPRYVIIDPLDEYLSPNTKPRESVRLIQTLVSLKYYYKNSEPKRP